jgi:AraC-like DNA-binding protein
VDVRDESRAAVAAGPLGRHVAYHGYRFDTGAPGTHRGLPSPYLTLIVSLDEPLAMRGDAGVVRRDLVLGGLHAEPVTIVHDGRQHGVHVVLDPIAARALLGAPTAALAGGDAGSLDALDVLGRDAVELHERVSEQPGWAARFAVLDEILTRRITAGHETGSGPGAAVRPEVRWAWRRLVAGGASVRDTAAQVGWSERHLSRRFAAEFGVGPKVAARLARFDRARRRIAAQATAGHPLGLADVAAEEGYADQAHLAREFAALAGCAPSRWVAEEVGYVQDGGGPVPEDSLHERQDASHAGLAHPPRP